MTIRKLQKFGALRKVYRGKGKIELSDGSEYPIRFTFAQISDGQLLISGGINKSIWDNY